MRAQFVYENLDFERGRDPKHAMDIGKIHNPIKIEYVEKSFIEEDGRKHWVSMYEDDVWRLFKFWPTVTEEEKGSLVVFGENLSGDSINKIDNKWIDYRGKKFFLSTDPDHSSNI